MKERPNLVAQQDIDEAQGRDRVAEAQVATAKAARRRGAGAARRRPRQPRTRRKTLFAYARITAPFAGVITHRYADTGAMIQAGTSSQTQAMPRRPAVAEQPAAPDHPGPRIGGRRGFTWARRSTSRCRRSTGTSRARSRASPTSSTSTRGRWRPRSTCRTRSSSWCPACTRTRRSRPTQAHDVVVAPVQAIDRKDDKTTVHGGGRGRPARAAAVTLGLESPDRVEVRTGLRAGRPRR